MKYTNTVANIVLTLMIPLMIVACGGGGIPEILQEEKKQPAPAPIVDSAGNYAGTVKIELLADNPKVSRKGEGRTNVVIQFVPRDENGFPLNSDQIDIELKINDRIIGGESTLQSSATELQFNVNLGLVLDTSYSMVDRMALQPMLAAAQQSVQSGEDIWKEKSGTFKFYTSWFNDYIFYSVDTVNKIWTPNDIATIPAPLVGSATKLFAATDFMINKLNALTSVEKPEGAPNDQNIMLVFSDGEDNYSWWDSSEELEPETLTTTEGAEFVKIGYKATSIENLLQNLEQSKNLTVHVIGLGDTINEQNLKDIAKAGNGTFRKNPDTDNLKTVFDQVVQEFTTLQTQGASMPLPPGEYEFTLKVSNKAGNQFAEYRFKFQTDENGASIVASQ